MSLAGEGTSVPQVPKTGSSSISVQGRIPKNSLIEAPPLKRTDMEGFTCMPQLSTNLTKSQKLERNALEQVFPPMDR